MKKFIVALVAVAVVVPALAVTAEANFRSRRAKNPAIYQGKSQEFQPRTRGAHGKPSFLQGSHKALGKY